MGQANKRGNYYERRDNAIIRNKAIDEKLDKEYGTMPDLSQIVDPQELVKAKAKIADRKEIARVMGVKVNERNIKFTS